MQLNNVLALDVGGLPRKWISLEDAVSYYVTDKVVWDLGETSFVFHGGISSLTGQRSVVVGKPIIALVGTETGGVNFEKETISLRDNTLLFRRDHFICAYCGNEFQPSRLTRDHIIPRSRGGSNNWMNVVTACKSCNTHKDNRTPEEAHMPLLYVPYKPCRWEHFILQNRSIIADQMEYLKGKLPKHSRYLNP